jgi:FAD/FMN-containing dehydrogenase
MPKNSITDALKRTFGDACILPDDGGYDAVRTGYLGGFDKKPAAIVRPRDAEAVSRVVGFAREAGLELAVRGGGHSFAGHSSTDGGIVLDLKEMNRIDIDAPSRTAWAETGATTGAFTKAAGEHGLAVGFGDAGSVGIGGITLGGGVGFLVRKHGLTIDSLLAAEVVTADGKMIRTDATSEPDLFWAIRGGGGNFGVVTKLKYRLHELPAFTGGMLFLPATAENLDRLIAAAEAAPDALSAIVNVMPAPPMPFLPAEARGKLVIMTLIAFAGPDGEAQAALRPFREIATPIADLVRPMSYAEMFPPEDPNLHPTVAFRTVFKDRFTSADAETIVGRLESSDAPMRIAQIRVLGGAAARVPNDATAYAHRDAPIMASVVAFYTSPEDRLVRDRWAADFAAALRPREGAYVNFLGNEGPERVRDAYPGTTWNRLATIKRRYDPENLFRLNHNVLPAPDADARQAAE